MAMMNAKEEDDIDLFIITAKKRLFTGRFIAVVLAKLLGIYRQRENKCYMLHATCFMNKVCLNLFFDEGNLEVPDFKKTEYVAHEVLQMKPLIVKGNIYQRFLKANDWVFEIFPNSKSNIKYQSASWRTKLHIKNQNFFKLFKFLIVTLPAGRQALPAGRQVFHFSFLIFNFVAGGIEKALKNFQLYFINKHRTTELITDTQLWFHPEDFGEKIHGLIRKKNG